MIQIKCFYPTHFLLSTCVASGAYSENQFFIYHHKHQNLQERDVEDGKNPKTQSFSFVFIYLNILIAKKEVKNTKRKLGLPSEAS